MSLLDRAVEMLAPHQCIGCGLSGHVLCLSCTKLAISPLESRCAGCSKLTKESKICKSCKWLNMYSVTVCGEYDGVHGDLVKAFKFGLKRRASKPIATILTFSAPYIKSDFIVTYIPTAPRRIRDRGFDHGKLLARTFSKEMRGAGCRTDLKHLLQRTSNSRQLGSSRAKRIKQMSREFSVAPNVSIKGKTVLVVDDIMTTGASLSAAATALKKAGAKRVYGLVLARKI